MTMVRVSEKPRAIHQARGAPSRSARIAASRIHQMLELRSLVVAGAGASIHKLPHHSPAALGTIAPGLGKLIGERLRAGLTLRLSGDLGSGKTCFVQGLARGLEVPEQYDITSPSYTLINEYPGRLPLCHADLYRLEGRMDAETVGLWDLFDSDAVVAVEWAERLDEADWPESSLGVAISIVNDRTRCIRLIGYGLESDNLIREAVENWSGY